MKPIALFVLSLALSVFGIATAATATQDTAGSSPGLTTDQVVQMVEAGLGEDLIITRLRRDGKAFNLEVEEMLRLKKAGVSDNILKVMVDPKAQTASVPITAPVQPPGNTPAAESGRASPQGVVLAVPGVGSPSGATTAAGVPAGDPNDPLSPHDSGIYVMIESREGKKELVVLERAAYQGSKTGGMLSSALTYGIKKVKTKAIIPGQLATIRIDNAKPEFYFYFDDKSAGLGKSFFGLSGLSNPNQFALVKLETKKSNRETIVGEIGAFGGSTGTHEKSMVSFRSERIRPGLYRVTPTNPLKDGEYCFLASSPVMGPMGAGAAGAMDIFDFGVSTR